MVFDSDYNGFTFKFMATAVKTSIKAAHIDTTDSLWPIGVGKAGPDYPGAQPNSGGP